MAQPQGYTLDKINLYDHRTALYINLAPLLGYAIFPRQMVATL
jgi:hypothetical protein